MAIKVSLDIVSNLRGAFLHQSKFLLHKDYASEENALAELISENEHLKNEIVFFDSGIKSRKTFDKFKESGQLFVTQGEANARC